MRKIALNLMDSTKAIYDQNHNRKHPQNLFVSFNPPITQIRQLKQKPDLLKIAFKFIYFFILESKEHFQANFDF